VFSSVETNSGALPPSVRIFQAGVNTAIALGGGPNKRTETQLKRWSRCASKRTLLQFVCGENLAGLDPTQLQEALRLCFLFFLNKSPSASHYGKVLLSPSLGRLVVV